MRRGGLGVGEHLVDAVGQIVVVAGLEQQAGVGALDDLGQAAGAGDDGRRAGGHALEGDDAERLVERGDDHAAGPVQDGAQVVVGDEAGQVDDVGDALDVDLGLQLGQVAAPAGDDAAHVGHPAAQLGDGPDQHLEALLVLHPAPRHHQRLALGRVLGGQRPQRRIDAVGHQVHLLDGQLEAVRPPRAP